MLDKFWKNTKKTAKKQGNMLVDIINKHFIGLSLILLYNNIEAEMAKNRIKELRAQDQIRKKKDLKSRQLNEVQKNNRP